MNQQRNASGLRALLETAYAAQARIEAKLERAGVSLAKLVALQALAAAGEALPLTQLAERLSCVKSNVTQLVDRLESDGLVVREADPGDRRTRLAVLTAAGRKACKEGTRVEQEAERALFRSLTRDEKSTLATLLGKIRARQE